MPPVTGIDDGVAVYGVNGQSDTGYGVWGQSNTNNGVTGESRDNNGVYAVSFRDGNGVFGRSGGSNGVYGLSERGNGVFAEGNLGILARGTPHSPGGAHRAGRFEGDVEVTGDIRIENADCAEDFDIVEENVEAGTVMVLNETGSLQPSYQEYDKKVAGIVSGAGRYKSAIVLDSKRHESPSKTQNPSLRLPIALMGKVYCKVDARTTSIEIGDLLTTSSTKGCAMKAIDPTKAFGTVIGKALGTMKEGIGMIPVLVALQ